MRGHKIDTGALCGCNRRENCCHLLFFEKQCTLCFVSIKHQFKMEQLWLNSVRCRLQMFKDQGNSVCMTINNCIISIKMQRYISNILTYIMNVDCKASGSCTFQHSSSSLPQHHLKLLWKQLLCYADWWEDKLLINHTYFLTCSSPAFQKTLAKSLEMGQALFSLQWDHHLPKREVRNLFSKHQGHNYFVQTDKKNI